ncbi:MAG TPA: glycosyltransferase family 2 protein [Burkholderiales bacterium]|nr:glycosyltransferase family 2 protein [Burkholderiales bacterium]
MLVSVVIPTFNAAGTLRACLDSLLAQTWRDMEVIVVDGGSTDGTREIIEAFSPRVAAWSSEPDRGIYDAANKGIARARGEWIYILGADDRLFDATALERMAPHLREAAAEAGIVYGRVSMVDGNDETLTVIGAAWPVTRKRLDSYMSLPHQGAFHRASLFRDHGGFDLAYRTGADYEFMLRVLARGEAVFVPDVVVARCRIGGKSSSAPRHMLLLREWRRAQRQHGLANPTLRWLVAYWGALLQRAIYALVGARAGARIFDFVRAMLGKPPYWSRLR